MRYNDYVVRVRVATKNGNVMVQEKSFKSADARAKWLDKLEADGRLVETLAFSDPQ